MAQSRRSSRRSQPADRRRGALSRRAAVWLATLGTIVGIATGMFTLRDHVFPGESGTSIASPDLAAYQQSIARVCDQINESDETWLRNTRSLRRELDRATNARDRGDALLVAAQRSAVTSRHLLSDLLATQAPPALERTKDATVAAWKRHLARISTYETRLARARGYRAIRAAIEQLTDQRHESGRDSLQVETGLRRLGGPGCQLREGTTTQPIRIPGAVIPVARTRSLPTSSNSARTRSAPPPWAQTGPPSSAPPEP